jgi:hypothetical protein
MDIAGQRLRNQHIATAALQNPADVVAWLGAVQAQDYLGGLWAVGLRTRSATELDVERALADRTILRTWPMRGTLHFVAASDASWMLDLLAARVIAATASRERQLELDEAVFARSRKLVVKNLEGGRQLTRSTLYARLEAAQISTAGGRGLHLPPFDEYTVAYKDRTAVLHPMHAKYAQFGGMLRATIVVNGQVAGTWKRTAGRAVVTITPAFFGRSRAEHLRIASAASVRYGRFLNLPVKVAGQRQPARSGL